MPPLVLESSANPCLEGRVDRYVPLPYVFRIEKSEFRFRHWELRVRWAHRAARLGLLRLGDLHEDLHAHLRGHSNDGQPRRFSHARYPRATVPHCVERKFVEDLEIRQPKHRPTYLVRHFARLLRWTPRDDNTDIICSSVMHVDTQFMHDFCDNRRFDDDLHGRNRPIISQGGSTNESEKKVRGNATHCWRMTKARRLASRILRMPQPH